MPPGVSIERFMRRQAIIGHTLDALRTRSGRIIAGDAGILFLLFAGHLIIVTIPLPLSILIAFVLMRQFISSNIMSLSASPSPSACWWMGNLMTENVIRQLRTPGRERESPAAPAERGTTLAAAHPGGASIFFAMAIIILAFVPVFVLGGGGAAPPLAFTKTFACVGATLLAVTLDFGVCAHSWSQAISCRATTGCAFPASPL